MQAPRRERSARLPAGLRSRHCTVLSSPSGIIASSSRASASTCVHVKRSRPEMHSPRRAGTGWGRTALPVSGAAACRESPRHAYGQHRRRLRGAGLLGCRQVPHLIIVCADSNTRAAGRARVRQAPVQESHHVREEEHARHANAAGQRARGHAFGHASPTSLHMKKI
eukprot:scaffold6445_cov113-Isochrysis_galbana.AAC.3